MNNTCPASRRPYIATSCVVSPAIPTQGVTKLPICDWRVWPPMCASALFNGLLGGDSGT